MWGVSKAVAALPAKSALAPAPSRVLFTSRWPRKPGDSVFGGTSGSGNVTLSRGSLAEAQAWGADELIWCYPNGVDFSEYQALISSVKSAGLGFGGAVNSSPSAAATINGQAFSNSEVIYDWAGVSWLTASGSPLRPAPFNTDSNSDGTTKYQRFQAWIDFATLCDLTNTGNRRVAECAQYVAWGATSMQMDDPRDVLANISSGFTSPSLMAGFRTWLLANTTAGDRSAMGLPATLPADLVVWMTTDNTCPFYSWFHTGLTVPTEIDQYAGLKKCYQIQGGETTDWRAYKIWSVWYQAYVRDTLKTVYSAMKSAMPGIPLSANMWNNNPDRRLMWVAGSVDYAVMENNPPTYPYTLDGRLTDIARNWFSILSNDAVGLHSVSTPIAIAPNAASSTLVETVLRQDICTYAAWGANTICPWDAYMQADQGVASNGYRYFGDATKFSDLYQFIKAKQSLLDGYKAIPDIGALFSGNYTPITSFAKDDANMAVIVVRIKAAMKAGIRPLPLIAADDGYSATPHNTADLDCIVKFCSAHDLRGLLAWANVERSVEAHKADFAALASKYARVLVNDGGVGSVLAWPRYNPTTGKTIIHLTNYLLSGNAPSQVSATLSGPLVDGKSFVVHRPGYSSVTMAPGSAIPVDQWAIVEIL